MMMMTWTRRLSVIAVSELLPTLVASFVYSLPWLFTSRLLYRRWRPGMPKSLKYQDDKSRLREFTSGFVILSAMLSALFWPVVVAVVIVAIGHDPTQAELSAKAEQERMRLNREKLEVENAEARHSIAVRRAENELRVATADMRKATKRDPLADVQVR
jgi:hypothetical protein